MACDTLITFLAIENTNLLIHSDPWIKSERDSIHNSCDVFDKFLFGTEKYPTKLSMCFCNLSEKLPWMSLWNFKINLFWDGLEESSISLMWPWSLWMQLRSWAINKKIFNPCMISGEFFIRCCNVVMFMVLVNSMVKCVMVCNLVL